MVVVPHASRNTKLFAEYFSKFGTKISYKKGEIIIRPDVIPTGVFFVKKGYIRIYSITPEGTEKLHIIYQPGDIFPLIWVLLNEQKKLFYEAMGDVELMRMKTKAFLDISYKDREFVTDLLLMMTDAFNTFSDRIDDLEISKSFKRVISCLIFFAKHYGQPTSVSITTSDSFMIKIPVTQQEIANFASLTRETVSREISRLEKKKLISYKNHFIVVNSMRGLDEEFDK